MSELGKAYGLLLKWGKEARENGEFIDCPECGGFAEKKEDKYVCTKCKAETKSATPN